MQFRETVAVYYENRTEHTDTPWGQNSEFTVKDKLATTGHQRLSTNYLSCVPEFKQARRPLFGSPCYGC
jgi:hypothetical protein